MSPKEWRFCFVKYCKPSFPEERLFCEILNTYFQEIDLMVYRKNYTTEELRVRELARIKSSSVLPMNLEKLSRDVHNCTTKLYCEFVDIHHDKFLHLINRYMRFRLGYDFTDI